LTLEVHGYGFSGFSCIRPALPGAHQMAIVVVCTVILSALAPGLTANPLASLLTARAVKQEMGG